MSIGPNDPTRSKRADQFVLALGDLLHKLRHPASTGQSDLMDRLQELVYTQDPGPLTDPLLFFQTIRAMQDEGRPTMKELSEASRVPKSTMTRIVDHWVRQGFAERVYDPEDRRIVRVTLTDRGRELRDIMLTYLERRVDSLLSPLSDADQATLVTLLMRISR